MKGTWWRPAPTGKLPEIITDPARLPPAVARTRERILAAARSGELTKLFAVMKEAPAMPVFSFSEDRTRSHSGRRTIRTPKASKRSRS